ncbi:MAG: ABC transporter ATP-binding protein [Egibacteraceae bacterium]
MLLEVDQIHSYYGSSHILHGVSLEVGEGEVVALIGRNGVGKSTTMKSVIGLVPPRRGAVRVLGKDVTGNSPHVIARMGVAYVPEERRIFTDLTVRQNLEMGTAAMRGNGRSGTWTFDRVVALFPNLGDRIAALGRHLSGGEQQMLAIGRALMSNPRILLLDEPSEGLAPAIVDAMQDALSALKKEGFTVLLAEQSLEFVEGLADRGCLLDKGVVVHQASMQDLLADTDMTHRYLAV